MGEFLIKLDIKYNITYFDNHRTIKSDSKVLEALEFDTISFKLKKNQTRIMIIGDSYIEGIGINETFRFKNQLNEFLIKNSTFNKEHLILNLSQPGNNFIDKYFSFLKYYNLYQPNIILWFHTINDLFMDSLKVESLKKKLIKLESRLHVHNQSQNASKSVPD